LTNSKDPTAGGNLFFALKNLGTKFSRKLAPLPQTKIPGYVTCYHDRGCSFTDAQRDQYLAKHIHKLWRKTYGMKYNFAINMCTIQKLVLITNNLPFISVIGSQ